VATICGVCFVAALFAIPSALSRIACFVPTTTLNNLAYYKLLFTFEIFVYFVVPQYVTAISYIMMAGHLVKSTCPISEETQSPQLNTCEFAAKIVVGITLHF
jgi:hypothetical protein